MQRGMKRSPSMRFGELSSLAHEERPLALQRSGLSGCLDDVALQACLAVADFDDDEALAKRPRRPSTASSASA